MNKDKNTFPLLPSTIKELNNKLSLGQRVAEGITKGISTWRFLIIFNIFICAWMVINDYMGKGAPDPFPYILLNLMLSWLAGVQAPLIMISQRRQDEIQATLDDKQQQTLEAIHTLLHVQHMLIQEKLMENRKEQSTET